MELSGIFSVVGMGIAGFVGGVITGSVGYWLTTFRLQSLEYRLEQLHLRTISGAGAQARTEKAERMSEAIAAVMAAVQKGDKPEDAIKAVAAQYPDVAMAVIQKALKGQLPTQLKGLV